MKHKEACDKILKLRGLANARIRINNLVENI